jgi:hypothetical protein
LEIRGSRLGTSVVELGFGLLDGEENFRVGALTPLPTRQGLLAPHLLRGEAVRFE